MIEIPYIPQGWQCPVCRRVYAPDYPFCNVCGQGTIVTNSLDDESGRLKLPEAYMLVMKPKEKQDATETD